MREEHTLTYPIGLLDTSVQVDSVQRLGDRAIARVIAYYPELAIACVENPDKEHLIPTLFGCSVAEFEADWQDYLAQHF